MSFASSRNDSYNSLNHDPIKSAFKEINKNVRSITPPPQPKIDPDSLLSQLPSDFTFFLRNKEFVISNGYPAPPSRNQEIRKCPCRKVYMIVNKDSPTTLCGYCQSH